VDDPNLPPVWSSLWLVWLWLLVLPDLSVELHEVRGNDVKHGLLPEIFFVVVAGDIVVGAALIPVLVSVFPVGPTLLDGDELLELPAPPLSLLPEAPDPDDGEVLLLGVEEFGIPLLFEDGVWLPVCLPCAAYTLVVINPLEVINATIVTKQTARFKVFLSLFIYCLILSSRTSLY